MSSSHASGRRGIRRAGTELALDELDSVVGRLPENALAETRRRALAHLREHGVPTVRAEDWKYTDLSRVVEISNEWLQGPDLPGEHAAGAVDAAGLTGIDGVCWLVIADGLVEPGALADAQAAGLDVTLLSETGAEELEFAAPLADLNAALLVDGLRIRVPAGTATDTPVGVLLLDSSTQAVRVAQVRVEVRVEAGASIQLVEYHHSTGSRAHYANSLVEIALAEGATAECVRIQDRDRDHLQTGRTRVSLARDSSFRHGAYDLGGALIRNDLEIAIDGSDASTEFSGIYLAGTGQHVDNHTRVDHRAGPARSRQEYRGIATGRGRCVWNGKAIVHPGADGTDAEQANHNLLLSDGAEIDAKPELEIYADDVKCSHGTTVGELDRTALYYLRTRGISRRDAERLLIQGFVHSVAERVPVSAARERLADLVSARLATVLEEAAT